MFWVLVVLILGQSCSVQKKCNRFVRKYPSCFKPDTIVLRDTFKQIDIRYSTISTIDTVVLDSVILKLNDTCISKYKIKDLVKDLPCSVPATEVDNDTFNLKVWYFNGKIHYDVKVKPRFLERSVVSKPVPVLGNCPKWKYLITGGIFGAAIFAILLMLRSKKLYV